jgi:hypothetical protein
MIKQDLELEAFSRFVLALEPWLGEAVVIGGWAHRLYRLDPRARKLDYLPLTTLDGDVAVPQKLKKQESFGSAYWRIAQSMPACGRATSPEPRRRD